MSTMTNVNRYSKVRPPKKKDPSAIMRLSSANDLLRREANGKHYLLLEKPFGRIYSNTTAHKRISARPPKSETDFEGPTPYSYDVKLPTPTVHGTKINPKSKYHRDALPNPNTEVWTLNNSLMKLTPGPNIYQRPNVLGQHCPVVRSPPAFSFTITPRKFVSIPDTPAPDSYHPTNATRQTFTHFPVFSIATKHHSKSGQENKTAKPPIKDEDKPPNKGQPNRHQHQDQPITILPTAGQNIRVLHSA